MNFAGEHPSGAPQSAAPRLEEPEAPARPRSSRHIPELDGVRALAIWMVICDHLIDGWNVPAGARVQRLAKLTLAQGWLGVDLFFVLSGFLITGILLDTRNSPAYFRNFYGRRFIRIIPLYFTVILIMSLSYRSGGYYFLLAALLMANFSYAFGAAGPNGALVFWSLAIEEHFYLAWPWAVRRLKQRALAVAACAIVAAEPILRMLAMRAGWRPDIQIYHYSFFRLDGLALGALLAIWARSPRSSRKNSLRLAAALLGVAGVVAMISPSPILTTGASLGYTRASLAFAGIVLGVIALQGKKSVAFFRWSFARKTAELSYCIYLIHAAVGDGYQYALTAWRIDPAARFGALGSVIARGVALIVVSYALAFASRQFLEQPLLRLKRYFAQ